MKILKLLPLILFLFSINILASGDDIYNVTAYGADPTGLKKSTKQIQKAIDECSKNGGGQVLIPTGKFITGTLIFRDNVNLNLQAGALLKGSPDMADYYIDNQKHGMIYGNSVSNISITGLGVIDGRGTDFMNLKLGHTYRDFDTNVIRQGKDYLKGDLWSDGPVSFTERPGMMVVLLSCENVKMIDVTFKDSPEWCVRLSECDNVMVRGVTILNNLIVPNSDGIHCTTSRNVAISDCDIRAGDDAIIVTGFGNAINVGGAIDPNVKKENIKIGNTTGYAENITVTNCQLQSRSSGIRVGYGENPIRNCVFSNIVIWESNRGIGVYARDNADIENIQFSNITIETRMHSGIWWGNGEAIHVSAIPRNKDVPVGKIKNIQFHNISAVSETGILLYGIEESRLEDIMLNNVRQIINNGELDNIYGGNFDLRPTADIKDGIFEHDIPGIYAQHIDGLKIIDFNLKWGKNPREYFSNGIEAEHVTDLKIEDFDGKQANGEKAVKLIDCSFAEENKI